VWVTAQALMAIERKPLPLSPVRRRGGRGGRSGGGRARAAGAGTNTSGSGNRQIAAKAHARRSGGAANTSATGGSATSLLAYAGDAALLAALVLAPVGET
jgi:hypothetical protein